MDINGINIPAEIICDIIRQTNFNPSLKYVSKEFNFWFEQLFFERFANHPSLQDRVNLIQKKHPNNSYEQKMVAILSDLRSAIRNLPFEVTAGDEQTKMLSLVPQSMEHFLQLEQWVEDVSLIHFFERVAYHLPHANLYLHSITNQDSAEKAKDISDKAKKMRVWLFSYGDDLSGIKKFVFSRHSLAKLPKEIGLCTGLEDLNLKDNNLICLPREIGKLTKLKSLDLIDNQLCHLPVEIAQLTQLECLCIEGNPQLTSLPPEMDALTNLKIMYIHPHQYKLLPPNIKKRIQSGEIEMHMLYGRLYEKQGLVTSCEF